MVVSVLVMTGIQLRLLRTAERVKTRDLAESMGVHSSRVSQIEAQAIVTDETAARYCDALDRITLTMSVHTAPETAQAS